MFVLLMYTTTGWTDALGYNAPADANQWPTEADAMAAAADLEAIGMVGPWRAVPLEEIDNYDLVA
jgi:hypothetical protein